jgi:hypothetical protein
MHVITSRTLYLKLVFNLNDGKPSRYSINISTFHFVWPWSSSVNNKKGRNELFVCWPENSCRGQVGERYRHVIGDHQEVEVKKKVTIKDIQYKCYADDRDADERDAF